MHDTSIGRCEGWCGTVDHHLVEGLCEVCRLRSLTIGKEPEPEMARNDNGPAVALLRDVPLPSDAVCWLPPHRLQPRSLFLHKQAS